MNYELVKRLSLKESKTLLQRMVKLQEEVGELAQEVLINQKVSGSQHKTEGKDGVKGECVDVILVALSIYLSEGGSAADFEKYAELKCQKWEKHQLSK